jgi:hypothetical protein
VKLIVSRAAAVDVERLRVFLEDKGAPLPSARS